ncbi:bifunctional diguanylate cyclase/phosphodiesterase [Pseudomonas oligotrophica]|uniref:bifunctional diguanylate cyclase/phosphodiesterase n=1 Tax=Pseudomonas oligotrophica TaxID=2912055 RepID=UPI001F30FDBC|nr:EAL domain-containing protein [Pseudomonas oligotrophica]MCF7204053.1 EAL domain-containing protein [Pseudomonas oligotrophica]
MSLLKQLFLAICLFLVVAFAGSFFASVEHSREQSISQLRSHAQDAATALALSMTPHVDDPVMLELLVNSIFDSGYFSSIRVVSISDEQPIVERTSNIASEQVPGWFAALVDLPAQGGDALIMRGWEQAARVEVVSHPEFALAKVWDSTMAILFWLLGCGLLSALLGGWLLRRQLKPLDRMVEQAHAISRREFVILPELPRTPELRRVVLAMNQMVAKLQGLFAEEAARSEKLHQQAYQDDLTGLANRRLLGQRLATLLSPAEHHGSGYLVLIRINDLHGLNQRLGSQYSDRLIGAIGDLLRRLQRERGQPDWLAGRSRGSDFLLLAPGLHEAQAGELAEELSAELETLRPTGASDSEPVAYIGLTEFGVGETSGEVLERADQALALAQNGSAPNWQEFSHQHPVAHSEHDWYQMLDEAFQRRTLAVFVQPVVRASDPGQVLHHKLLARLPAAGGELLTAGRFLPWVERLGWAARFDLLMLERAIEHLRSHPAAVAVSLSSTTLRDTGTLDRIVQLLRDNSQQAGYLYLELDARHLPTSTVLQQSSQALRATGAHVGLQHFGGDFSRLTHLAHLGFVHLKIDGTYVRGIDQDEDKRLFIEALYRTTHSIEVPLIAEMVETEAERTTLAALGVVGVMGHAVGAPQPAPDY